MTDDMILPDKIKLMLEQAETVKENIILYSNLDLGEESNIFEKMPMNFALNLGYDVTFDANDKKFALDFGITPTCFLFPRKAISDAKWDIELGPGEDWDYYLQILNNNYIFWFLPETLVLYRNTSDSYSKNTDKSVRSSYRVLVSWLVRKNRNLFCFSKRCALVFKKSILLYLMKKTDKIIKPDFKTFKFTLLQYIFVLLIYPLTVFYLSLELFRVALKRIKIYFK